MKVFFAGNLKFGHHSSLRVEALRELGHDVIEFDFQGYNSSNRYLNAIAYRYGFGSFVKRLNINLIDDLLAAKPDIIWIEKGTYVKANSLKRIAKRTKAKLIHFNPDDPFGQYKYGWKIFKKAIPFYDLHFVPRPQNISEYYGAGARRVVEYDRSYSSAVHKPMELSEEEKKKYEVPVGFIGTYASERAKSILFLLQNGIDVAIYGNHWRNCPEYDELKDYIRSDSVFGEEYAKIISGMDIALHYLRKENRDFQDSRTFEIPACGTFMLAEKSQKHMELFKDGQEAVFFDTNEELLEKILYFKNHSKERERIAMKGLLRCKSSGYDHGSRLEQLLKIAQDLSE